MFYLCHIKTNTLDMTSIYTDIETMDYPVGRHITKNKPKILELAKAFSEIEEFKGRDINLICKGSSGAIIATIFSMILPNNTNIVHIKKKGEDSHDCGEVRFDKTLVNIIVDDFISSGQTLNSIYNKLLEKGDLVIDCVCVTGSYRPLEFIPRYVVCSYK